ncbi:MAG: type IV toxin-antitoxin system AbiEi family antitoxin [Gammaproteobacteria bacterium]|nr:type IV toxin-antitoxin system AbiEi family antitoxin [Gammaproteobacteria bacterium]
MKNFKEYIRSVRANGYHSFTASDALLQLGISKNAFNCGMYKLRKKGEIISPAKNLYVIISPEYQNVGCLPADELIPILMKHWNINYYVCLLSAALCHGATHQRPQVFQVMTEKQLKPLTCGKIRIEFIYKKSFANIPIQKIIVKTGYLNISSPELTAMDLLLYLHKAGGLNHVATVLSELLENITPEKILKLIQGRKENAWIQRLGYILEHIDPIEIEKRDRIVNLLYGFLKKRSMNYIPLASELPVVNQFKNNRWKVIENTTIKSDI